MDKVRKIGVKGLLDKARIVPLGVKGLIVALFSVVIGGGLIWWGTASEAPLNYVLEALGGVIITGGFFSWLGAVVARTEIAYILMSKFGYQEKLKEVGIIDCLSWDIDIPINAKKIDMLFVRAHSWLGLKAPRLSKIVQDTSSEIRICLVNPNSMVLSALARKYGEDEAAGKQKIKETIRRVIEATEEAKKCSSRIGRLCIFGHSLIPHYTYYRFDDDYYFIFYAMRRGRIPDLPTLKLSSDGKIKKFLEDDFEKLCMEEDTITIYDTARDKVTNRTNLCSIGFTDEELEQIFTGE